MQQGQASQKLLFVLVLSVVVGAGAFFALKGKNSDTLVAGSCEPSSEIPDKRDFPVSQTKNACDNPSKSLWLFGR